MIQNFFQLRVKNSKQQLQDLLFPTLIIQEESTETKIIFVEHKKNIINIPYKSKYVLLTTSSFKV